MPKFVKGWATGKTLKVKAYYDNVGTMTLRGSELTLIESPAGVYSINYPTLQVSDMYNVTEGTKVVLSGTYIGTGAMQRIVQAAKFIINKTVQDKETGAITVFDDDSSTPLVTLTPVETDTEITKNRSEV